MTEYSESFSKNYDDTRHHGRSQVLGFPFMIQTILGIFAVLVLLTPSMAHAATSADPYPATYEWSDGQFCDPVSPTAPASAQQIYVLPGNSPHSVIGWVKPNQQPQGTGWILQLGHDYRSHTWTVTPDLSNAAQCIGSFGSGLRVPLKIGQWQFVAITYDGTTQSLSVNGIPIGAKPGPFLLSGMPTKSVIPLTIATVPGNVKGAEFFKGGLGSVRVFNRALSAAELEYWMQFERHPDTVGAPRTFRKDLVTGRSAAKTTPNVDMVLGCSPHTISAWVKPNKLLGGREWMLQLGNDIPGSHHWLISPDPLNPEQGICTLGVFNGARLNPKLYYGLWQHVAVTYDGTTLSCFIDGALNRKVASSKQFNLWGLPLSLATASVKLRAIGDKDFTGNLQEVRVYDRCLTAVEVAELSSWATAEERDIMKIDPELQTALVTTMGQMLNPDALVITPRNENVSLPDSTMSPIITSSFQDEFATNVDLTTELSAKNFVKFKTEYTLNEAYWRKRDIKIFPLFGAPGSAFIEFQTPKVVVWGSWDPSKGFLSGAGTLTSESKIELFWGVNRNQNILNTPHNGSFTRYRKHFFRGKFGGFIEFKIALDGNATLAQGTDPNSPDYKLNIAAAIAPRGESKLGVVGKGEVYYILWNGVTDRPVTGHEVRLFNVAVGCDATASVTADCRFDYTRDWRENTNSGTVRIFGGQVAVGGEIFIEYNAFKNKIWGGNVVKEWNGYTHNFNGVGGVPPKLPLRGKSGNTLIYSD